jgi:hypothetical protein
MSQSSFLSSTIRACTSAWRGAATRRTSRFTGPHGAKPDREGQMTVLENGSCGDRHFIPAVIAKPAIPSNRPGICASAPWTHPTARPAQCREVFGASLLAAKAPFQLQQSPRKILVHDPEVYILGLVASSKYPYWPLGLVEKYPGLAAGQLVTIREGQGIVKGRPFR